MALTMEKRTDPRVTHCELNGATSQVPEEEPDVERRVTGARGRGVTGARGRGEGRSAAKTAEETS